MPEKPAMWHWLPKRSAVFSPWEKLLSLQTQGWGRAVVRALTYCKMKETQFQNRTGSTLELKQLYTHSWLPEIETWIHPRFLPPDQLFPTANLSLPPTYALNSSAFQSSLVLSPETKGISSPGCLILAFARFCFCLPLNHPPCRSFNVLLKKLNLSLLA